MMPEERAAHLARLEFAEELIEPSIVDRGKHEKE